MFWRRSPTRLQIELVKPPSLLLAASLTGALSGACAPKGLGVEPVALSVERPSHVALYVAVANGDDPVTDLSAASFALFEDGIRLDPNEVKLRLLDRDTAAAHRTLLVLDAGNLSPAQATTMARAAAAFARVVRRTQPVSVYAFYAGPRLEKIVELPRDATGPTPDALEGPAAGRGDAARDLNGAVILGLEQLAADLGSAEQAVRLGTLVVVTRGPDLAGRVSTDQLQEQLDATRAAVIAVGVGDDSQSLNNIGRKGTFQVASFDALPKTMEQAAARVDALYRGRYLVAYCSPARAGQRTLKVEVKITNAKGLPEVATLETPFDATGFAAGCDNSTRPRFLVTLVAGPTGPRWAWIPAAMPDVTEAAKEPETVPEPEAAPPGEGEAAAPAAEKGKPKPRARHAHAAPKPATAPQPAPPPKAPPAAAPPPKEKPPPTDFEP
jgi:hypothetical protein